MPLCKDSGCFFSGVTQCGGYCAEHWKSSKRISRSRRERSPSPTFADLLASPMAESSILVERNNRSLSSSLPAPKLYNQISLSRPSRKHTLTTPPSTAPYVTTTFSSSTDNIDSKSVNSSTNYFSCTRNSSLATSNNKCKSKEIPTQMLASTEFPVEEFKRSYSQVDNDYNSRLLAPNDIIQNPQSEKMSISPTNPAPPPSATGGGGGGVTYSMPRSLSVTTRPKPNSFGDSNLRQQASSTSSRGQTGVDGGGQLLSPPSSPGEPYFVKFNVKQKQRFGGFKSEAVLRIDVSLQMLSILKARTKKEKKEGNMQNSKQYPCDSISEMTVIGDCKLSILIADGSHKGKGTKKDFEFNSNAELQLFIKTMNDIHNSTINKHRSAKGMKKVNDLSMVGMTNANKMKSITNESLNNKSLFSPSIDQLFDYVSESTTLRYRCSTDISLKRDSLNSDSIYRPTKHRRNGSMSRRAIQEAALSITDLLAGEEYLLCVDHVLVMGQQPLTTPSFASNKMKDMKKKNTTYGTGSRGQMIVTNYRVMFDDYNSAKVFDYVIPVAIISSLSINKKMGKGTIGGRSRSCTLTIKQSGWRPTFQFKTQADMDSFVVIVKHHSFLDIAADPTRDDTFFAFQYLHSKSKDGWMMYDPIEDYTRLGMISSSSSPVSTGFSSTPTKPPPPFRIFENNYQLTSTYPSLFLVPRTISDDVIVRAAEYRSRKRTVAAVWMDPETRVSLSRCSQPMRGLANHSSIDDQNLILSIPQLTLGDSKSKKLIFVDCRGALAAFGNKTKGKGTENIAKDYPQTELLYLNIENIHHMRRSLDELTDICEPLNQSSWEEDWYSKVDASLWLRHLRLLIGGCHEVIRLMQIEKSCVVCHCSDGWDRTAQLCALAELLMDPYYRTCRGFVILIEKEWLSFGHKFHDRVGHGDATGYPGSQERSPIFVQWLDSVYQLTLQFPNAFEFSEDFLICIADHHLSCCYGTFLYNSEWERRARNLASKTTSLWSDMIGRQEDKPNLYNNCYNPDQVDRVLYPSSSIRNLKVWSNLWLRRDPPNQHN